MTDGLGQSSVGITSTPKKSYDTCNIMLIDKYICCHKYESVYIFVTINVDRITNDIKSFASPYQIYNSSTEIRF